MTTTNKDIRTITKENWNAKEYAEKTIAEIKATIGDGKAICAMSGGVVSAVAALLESQFLFFLIEKESALELYLDNNSISRSVPIFFTRPPPTPAFA